MKWRIQKEKVLLHTHNLLKNDNNFLNFYIVIVKFLEWFFNVWISLWKSAFQMVFEMNHIILNVFQHSEPGGGFIGFFSTYTFTDYLLQCNCSVEISWFYTDEKCFDVLLQLQFCYRIFKQHSFYSNELNQEDICDNCESQLLI